MKAAICTTFIASAAASPPAKQAATTTSLASLESELSAQDPLGFFDPLGMVTDGDQEKFDSLRYVELKHGRICQLGFLGQITTRNGIHLGGDIDYSGHSFESSPNGITAMFGPDAIPSTRTIQMFLFVGALELP
jgi:hypothetical protein